MNEHWSGICATVALIALLVLVIRYHVHAFIALLVVSLGLGLAAGLPPAQVIDAVQKGIGEILRDVILLLALGAILGRMLETSGAAELIARRLIQACGEKNTSLAILLAAFLIGIPILFNVAFLLLIPIVWRLQRETKRSLLYFLLPLTFSLGTTHSLVPPHPGIVGAVNNLAGTRSPDQVMVESIIFGIALSLPVTLAGWLGPGLWWANRQHVSAPEATTLAAQNQDAPVAKSFTLAMTIILAPLVLSLAGFGAKLLQDLHHLPAWMTCTLFDAADLPTSLRWLNHSTLDWLQFFGKPTMALFVPTALAFWSYGLRRGWSQARLAKLTTEALIDVGGMVFLFAAAGGFKEVIQATGVGPYLAEQMFALPLPPIVSAFAVAALVRIALGSATAAILTASALLGDVAKGMPGQETLLVLAVASGVTIATQPADSGFWMLKEYGNLTVRDVLVGVNFCRGLMAFGALGLLLLAEALLRFV
jgi:gluconate transporter